MDWQQSGACGGRTISLSAVYQARSLIVGKKISMKDILRFLVYDAGYVAGELICWSVERQKCTCYCRFVINARLLMNKIQSIIFCGHSAVLIKCTELVIGIDPWLKGNPLCPEYLHNPEKLDVIVLTHGHADHAGDTVRLAQRYGARIVATYELAMLFADEGIDHSRLMPMNKGGTLELDGLNISLTNAFHSSSFDSPTRGIIYAGEACGVVVGDDHTRIYHAGDTALFQDLSLIRAQYSPTIAFLPIGDRFTMGPKEAAIGAQMVGAFINVPIHYGTFPALTGRAEDFEFECKRVGVEGEVRVLGVGDEIKVGE